MLILVVDLTHEPTTNPIINPTLDQFYVVLETFQLRNVITGAILIHTVLWLGQPDHSTDWPEQEDVQDLWLLRSFYKHPVQDFILSYRDTFQRLLVSPA